MATAPGLDADLMAVGLSMDPKSIPAKARCCICDKIAIDAWKLPCCENIICTFCHQKVTASECPVCFHSPFDISTCTPSKSTANTVKVLIRTEAKKRKDEEAARIKQSISTPSDAGIKNNSQASIATEVKANDVPAWNDIENRNVADALANTGLQIPKTEDDEEYDEDDIRVTIEKPEKETDGQNNNYDEDQPDNAEEGGNSEAIGDQVENMYGTNFNQNMNSFPGGNFDSFNNGFNPMMQMGFMGMPNMMGMPGMGMDQSMMFNGGFGNSGGMGDMGMMGMGMGMGGGMTGMTGYHDMAGPGYFQPQPSYMQSNFGNAQRQPFLSDRGYGRPYGRGYGRGGRGYAYGRGRGGWNNNHQQYPHQQAHYSNDANVPDQAANQRGSPNYDSVQAFGADGGNEYPVQQGPAEEGQEYLIGERSRQTPSKDVGKEDTTDVKASEDFGDEPHSSYQSIPNDQEGLQQNGDEQFDTEQFSTSKDTPLEGFGDETQHQNQPDFGAPIRGRGGFRGRGSHSFGAHARAQDSVDSTSIQAPPANAPTGPKAMRQGLPNTGWSGRISAAQKPTLTRSPTDATYEDDKHGDGQDETPRSRSRSQSQHRSRRYHEDSASDEYERRKERDRRKRKDRDRERRYSEDDHAHAKGSEDKKSRARSESPSDDDSKRRRRRRDKEEEHRLTRSRRDKSRSHHRRRHRSRSPRKDDADSEDDYSRRHSRSHADHDDAYSDGDRVREKEKKHKHSRRDDDYDYDKKDRSSHRSKTHRTARGEGRDRDSGRDRQRKVIEPPSDELGFKIKGSRSARAAKDNAMDPPSSTTRDRGDHRSNEARDSASASVDPYAEERARAQQGREAREVQRRQSTKSASLLGKRSSRVDDDDYDIPRGPKGDRGRGNKGHKERRIYRYDDEDPKENDDDDGGERRWR